MTERGVLFRLRARGAESVAVAGSFEGWEPLPMRRCRNGLWRLPVDVPPGDHAYAFLVDGLWIHDPDNPALASHEQHPDAPLEAPSRVRVQHEDVVVPRGWAAREVSFGFRATYDRVDQAGVYGSLHYHDRARLHPEITLLAGYAFGREQGLYDIDFAQPLLGPRTLDLGGSVYRRTDTRDAHRIGATENSIAALVARQDWRDWFEAEGLELSATAYLGLLGTLTAGYGREEHRSLDKTTDWGLLFPNRDMRENPAVDEGRFRSVRLAFERDSRNHERNPERGGLLRATWESFGGDAGGDYDFRRATAEIRRYVTVSPGYWVDFRLAGGRIDDAFRGDGDSRVAGFDAIPSQERFYLGGIGTMRATRFKSLQG
ncbi:MAG: BamA/TamA family outer membrane protein, partial [Gemmatimonadetes bacterium]|nr:BamA/TamA family outer membrane protein [Gemmatimonadota bacterium]